MRTVIWFPFYPSVTKNGNSVDDYSITRTLLPLLGYFHKRLPNVVFLDPTPVAPVKSSDLYLLQDKTGGIKTTQQVRTGDVLIVALCNFRAFPGLFESKIAELERHARNVERIIYYEADEEVGADQDELYRLNGTGKNCNLLSYLKENPLSHIKEKLSFVVTISPNKTRRAIESELGVEAIWMPNILFEHPEIPWREPVANSERQDIAVMNYLDDWLILLSECPGFSDTSYLYLGNEKLQAEFQNNLNIRIKPLRLGERQQHLISKLAEARLVVPSGKPYTNASVDWPTSKLFEAAYAGALCSLRSNFPLSPLLNRGLDIDLTYNRACDLLRICGDLRKMSNNKFNRNIEVFRENVKSVLGVDAQQDRMERIVRKIENN